MRERASDKADPDEPTALEEAEAESIVAGVANLMNPLPKGMREGIFERARAKLEEDD